MPLIFQAVSMGVLANYLHQVCRTTVTGQTHIMGKFDFTLDIDSAINELANQSPPRQNSFGDFVRAAVEDFGFRVETQKVTVDVTVIDHAERPSEN